MKKFILVALLAIACKKEITHGPFYARLGKNIWMPVTALSDTTNAFIGDSLFTGNGLALLQSASFTFDTSSGIVYDNIRLFVNDRLVAGNIDEITGGKYSFDSLSTTLNAVNTFYIKVRYLGAGGTIFRITLDDLKVMDALTGEIITPYELPLTATLKIK